MESYLYDPYGNVTVFDANGDPVSPNPWGTAHSAIGNPYLFTGRRFDEETGLYYYRARYFDDDQGRFISRDPAGFANEVNLYSYSASLPTRYMDPGGDRFINKGQQGVDFLHTVTEGRGGTYDIKFKDKIAPVFEYEEKNGVGCCWVKDKTGLITVEFLYVGVRSGWQQNPGTLHREQLISRDPGPVEWQITGYAYITRGAARAMNTHEIKHGEDIQRIYDRTLGLAEENIEGRRKKNPLQMRPKELCELQLEDAINWHVRHLEFMTDVLIENKMSDAEFALKQKEKQNHRGQINRVETGVATRYFY